MKGVKVRATGPGVVSLGLEMVELAKTAAVEGGVPLMVHIGDRFHEGDGPVLTQGLLPLLEAGDIVTHLYTGNPGRIIDDAGDLLPEVIEARERGVILDAAHGRQNFSFDVAKRALDAGLAPDTISSDLTGPGRRGVVHSLLSIMGRFIALGLPLEDVIRRTTVNPARVLGIDHAAGSLAPGRPADVAVLEQVTGRVGIPGRRRRQDRGYDGPRTRRHPQGRRAGDAGLGSLAPGAGSPKLTAIRVISGLL